MARQNFRHNTSAIDNAQTQTSDTPERRLERQHRHRRGKRFENWISGINKIAAHGDDEKNSFLERALETGIQPKPYLNLIKSRATLDNIRHCHG